MALRLGKSFHFLSLGRGVEAGRSFGFGAIDGSLQLAKEVLAGRTCAAPAGSRIDMSVDPLECGP